MEDLLPRALPVDGEPPVDGEWNVSGQTALTYLQKVRQEAASCPEVAIAPDIPVDAFEGRQTFFVSAGGGTVRPPDGFQPDIQWQIKQILEFSKLRDKISKMRSKFEKSSHPRPGFPPDVSDGRSWIVWCCGKSVFDTLDQDEDDDDDDGSDKDYDDALDDTVKSDDDDDEGKECPSVDNSVSKLLDHVAQTTTTTTETPTSPPKETSLTKGHAPLLSVVLFMNQAMVEKVLAHHVDHIRSNGFHLQQGPWIYAFLALLHKPLVPDTCSLLRELARLCSQSRARLDRASHAHLRPFNLFIAVVARYFDQRDMADAGGSGTSTQDAADATTT